MKSETRSGIPKPAAWLGAAGVIPFLAGAAGMWLLPPAQADDAARLMVAYGAVILSFMGAIHWGLVMWRNDDECQNWYVVSVLPALAAWVALMLPPLPALSLLAVAFILVYAFDRTAIAAGIAPPWYRALRTPLTTAVATLLLLGLLAATLRPAA